MYSPQQREQIRNDLLALAASDPRIEGVAITGSAAEDREDSYSDVDLAFGIREGSGLQDVLSEWTARLYQQHTAVHHVDVLHGSWVYRVFLLPNTLQVDLAFTPAADFRALAPSFRLVAGTARDPQHAAPPPADVLIGYGWLYALHARSAIAREKFWQAEYMISGVRDQALALACLRHGLSAYHGKGMDTLPAAIRELFENALIGSLNPAELSRAFAVATRGLIDEIHVANTELATRLEPALLELVEAEKARTDTEFLEL